MRSSDSLANIAPALVAALAELKGAPKDSKNPHFRNDYASLESVIETARPVLAKHDLAVLQGLGEVIDGRFLTTTTRIIHTSGEWIESSFQMPLPKADPQGTGSAASYSRRYALMAMLNVPAVDDDGEAATNREPPPQTDRNGAGPSPEGPDWWGCSGPGLTAHAAKKEGLGEKHEALREELGKLSSAQEWRQWCADNSAAISTMPKAWRVILRAEAQEVAETLGVDLNHKRAA